MTRLRRSGKQLIKALRKADFEVLRVRGSHPLLRHGNGRMTVVPVHAGEVIGPGLLHKTLAECEMTRDEIQGLL